MHFTDEFFLRLLFYEIESNGSFNDIINENV